MGELRPMPKLTPDEQLADALARFYADPLGYVMFAFPWDTDREIQLVELAPEYRERFNCKYGPDKWACEFLDDWGREIAKRGFDGHRAVPPIQFSTASGHGIGKTTLSAWIIKFIMDTRPFCRGTVTAGTDTQLRTKTWAELGKWHRLSLTAHWFDYSTGRGAMALRHRKYPESWFCTAQTCREENSEAFAGQHAANSTSFYLFDEASQIPDIIYEVREGGLTDGEPMVFDFGNPTRNSGRFFENCVGKFKDEFIVRSIDSRNVAITNKEYFAKKIELHGEDSDYARVRIRGLFPRQSSTQFIPSDIVEEAGVREILSDRRQPLVIGVDVARFGDDETVIWPRIGMDARSFAPTEGNGRWRRLDTNQVVGRVISTVAQFRTLGLEPAAIFIDQGYNPGVVDNLRNLGYNVVGINFGGKPTDSKYRFKVDEMWGKMKDALESKLAIPPRNAPTGEELYTQLTQREFGYTLAGEKINLESKAEMKERLGIDGSPDLADALALTFAQDVAPAAVATLLGTKPQMSKYEYDPLESDW